MKIKRLLACSLAVVLAFSVAGCTQSSTTGASKTGNKKSEYKTSGEELVLWYEPSTTKLVQYDEGETAKTADEKQTLIINMARNEEEGVQLMMYAKKNIASYSVKVSDLVSGNSVIKAENIDIYQMKYQTLEQLAPNPVYIDESIPDPLLPFEKAVEYKENVIKKGNNQGIYLDVATEKTTPAGTYQGVVSVTTEGDEYQILLKVTVYNVTLPDTAGLKTAFNLFDRDHFGAGELDSSMEMYTTYMDTLLEFNMSNALPYEGTGGIPEYLELLREYYNKPGFSAYRMYYSTAWSFYDGVQYSMDLTQLKEYVKAIAEISVEDHVNYLDKAYNYFYTVVDEPHTETQFLKTKEVIDLYMKMLYDADAELREQFAGTAGYAYYDSVVSDTVKNIEYVVPGVYSIDDMNFYHTDGITYCPQISVVNTQDARNKYTEGRDGREFWVYTCAGPVFPYPSFHKADYSVGTRLISWMCYDYSFDAFLMWAAANYLYAEYGQVVIDIWETSPKWSNAGDGQYFYPGAKYGIEGPCPSLRAMAWRDGVDDYALLEEVEAICNQSGLTADALLSPFFERLYTGTVPGTDAYVLEEVRQEVFDTIMYLKSDLGVLYGERELEINTASISFKPMNENAKVTYNKKKLSPDKDGFYKITVNLQEQKECDFTVTFDKEKRDYTYTFIQGELKINDFEKTKKPETYFFSTTPGYKVELAQDKVYAGENAVRVTLNESQADIMPYLAIAKDSELIGGSWKGIKNIRLAVYNPAKETVLVNASYFSTAVLVAGEYELAPESWTILDIPMLNSISNVDSIQELDLIFEQGSAVEVYIDSFCIEEE